MRKVLKEAEPASLMKWKATSSEDWEPTYKRLQHPEKGELQTALLAEQGQTCCYCGRAVTRESSHIEHFRPQSAFPHLALTFTNLFASCGREHNPGAPMRCGYLKANWFDEDLSISPLEIDCEGQFWYSLSGEITGSNPKANKMAAVLGLDLPSVQNERRSALEGVFDEAFLLSASASDLKKVITGFRTKVDGAYASYFHVVARYAEQLLSGSLTAN